MLGDNLKAMRKAKGYTQEELAIRLNVVRQTVSKWEKGISVPDADALAMLADVLDTDVSALLGDAKVDEADKVSIAEQLARINEQFAVRNSRSKARWKIVGIVLAVVAVLIILLVIINTPASSSNSEAGSAIDLINSGPEQIRYGDRMIDKVGLSEQTLEWLDWYNGLTEEEQAAVDYIPLDLADNFSVKVEEAEPDSVESGK